MASDKVVDPIEQYAAEIAKLQSKMEAEKAKRRDGALEDAKKLVATFKFTANELGIPAAKQQFKRKPAIVKYINPDDRSQTWTGRGRQPAWTTANGRKLGDCAVKP